MEVRKTVKKRVISMICAAAVLCSVLFYQNPVYAAIPKISQTPTTDRVESLLKMYNKDSYYIVNTERASLKAWCDLLSQELLIEELDDIVHETYHGYTFTQGGFTQEAIYIGDKKNIMLECYDDLYRTSKCAAAIPNSLRTFRFDDYVGSSAQTDSNVYGIYGLMNEFTAYYWGLDTMCSLKEYYGKTDDGWRSYVISLGNNMTAYAEFKFWILNYMIYAREHNPKLYKKLMTDKHYCKAYYIMERKFARLINKEIKNLDSINPDITYSSEGIYFKEDGVDLGDYFKLKKEMKKSKYIKMDEKMKTQARAGKKG